MTYKILFLHGFFNSGQCDMAMALRNCLTEELRAYDDMYAEDEVEVICPDLPPNPYNALDVISETIERDKVDDGFKQLQHVNKAGMTIARALLARGHKKYAMSAIGIGFALSGIIGVYNGVKAAYAD